MPRSDGVEVPPALSQRVYAVLASPLHSRVSRIVNTLLVTLILANVAALILETVDSIGRPYARFFTAFELFSVIVFTAEYVLRLWACTADPRYEGAVRGRLRWARSPLALIDFIAFVPFYLPFLPVDLRFARLARVFRVARLAKLARYSDALQSFGRVLKSKKEDLVVTLAIMVLLLVVSSCLIYYAEQDAQPDRFSSIPASMWWAISTLTTVGYGDVYPITGLGRLCASVIAVLGIAMFALPAGILGSGYVAELEAKRRRPSAFCPHCGQVLEPGTTADHAPG